MTVKKPAKKTPKQAPIQQLLGERIDSLHSQLSAWEQEIGGRIDLAQNIAESAKHDVKTLRCVVDMQTKADAGMQAIQDDQAKELRRLAGELRRIAESLSQQTNSSCLKHAALTTRMDWLEQREEAEGEQRDEDIAQMKRIAANSNNALRTMTVLFVICVVVAGVALFAAAF